MRQNDRVVALLLPLVVSYRSYLPKLARFASIGENRWLPGERPRVRIRPYVCQHVTFLVHLTWFKHCHMFSKWWGVEVAKKQAL